jgi:hypothetical protein
MDSIVQLGDKMAPNSVETWELKGTLLLNLNASKPRDLLTQDSEDNRLSNDTECDMIR